MDIDMVNLAVFIADGLQKMMHPGYLYVTGNMQASVTVVAVNEDFIDIVIATDYASYTNTRGKTAGWVERTVDRLCRAFASNNDVDNVDLTGNIIYGG